MLKPKSRHETKPFGALSLIGREEEKEEEKEKEEEEETLMSVSLHARVCLSIPELRCSSKRQE